MFYCCLRKKKTTTKKKKEKKTFSLILMWDRELIHSLSRCTSGEGPEREEELFLRHGWESLCHVLCLFEIKKMFLFFLTLIFLIYLFSYLFLLLPSLSCLPSYGRSTTFHLPPQLLLPANDGPLAAPRCDLSIRLSPLDLLFSQRISRGRRGRNLLCERTEEEEPGLLIDVDEAGREKGDLRWLNGTSCFGGLGCATASSRPRRKNWAFKSRAGAFPVSHAYGTDGEQKREERVWTIVVGKVAQENSLDPFHVHSSFSAESWCIQTASSLPRSQQWQCIITAAAAAANRGTRGAVRPSFALAADGPEHPKE